MKRFLAASFFAFLPLQALGQDAPDCAAEWESVAALAGAFGDGAVAGEDGWCELATTKTAILDATLGKAAFRFDQSEEALPNGRSIEVRIADLQTQFGTYEGIFALNHQTQTGAVQLHQFRLRGGDRRGLRATAFASLPALKSNARAQNALTDLTVNRANVDVFVTPALLGALQIRFSQITRRAVDSALRDVSEGQVSGKSRREFLRFMGAAPNARGTLSVAVEMSGDASLFERIAPFVALARAPSDDDITSAFDAAFDGVSIDLAWKPGRM